MVYHGFIKIVTNGYALVRGKRRSVCALTTCNIVSDIYKYVNRKMFSWTTGAASYFEILHNISTSQGQPYDYRSTVHFTRTEFTRSHHQLTITKRNPEIHPTSVEIKPSTFPTFHDLLHIKFLYCQGTVEHRDIYTMSHKKDKS